ncbi:hypothetical protein [Pedobacter nyackensis]|uniref:Uncharacterized protein n=1 Tax=Pedobacter nyackensis TaxID=475255 RepID=A0A1W2A8G9_9SPHI|nr:hypothetical protein [Pedobacter nyackensis]SMC56944.1 hypothetical protein SAMN04488101_101308 [Pedobacter nyackensis]
MYTIREEQTEVDISGLIYRALGNLKKLDILYLNADIEGKRAILSSIFYEKWTFWNGKHRTPEINEAAQLIYHINRNLRQKKTGADFYSGEVPPRTELKKNY